MPMKDPGTQCWAIKCTNCKNKQARYEGITFHMFPNKEQNKERYAIWVRNCRRTDTPSRTSLICSKHFEEAYIDRTGQIVRLRNNAIPTIFNLPSYLQKHEKERRTLKRYRPETEETFIERHVTQLQDIDTNKTILNDHNYPISSQKKLRKKTTS